jgi:hypothetical protein
MNDTANSSLNTAVDDEVYHELTELVGQKVVYLQVWEDLLAGELEGSGGAVDDTEHFDLDLYLADGVYFELYSVQCFSDPDSEPWPGLEQTRHELVSLIKRGLWLEEIAVDEEEGLVLVLGNAGQPLVYLDVGGWLIEEWDELPDA